MGYLAEGDDEVVAAEQAEMPADWPDPEIHEVLVRAIGEEGTVELWQRMYRPEKR